MRNGPPKRRPCASTQIEGRLKAILSLHAFGCNFICNFICRRFCKELGCFYLAMGPAQATIVASHGYRPVEVPGASLEAGPCYDNMDVDASEEPPMKHARPVPVVCTIFSWPPCGWNRLVCSQARIRAEGNECCSAYIPCQYL